jgi:hypothetical protein
MMGKKWDAIVPGPHFWREVCRVLKPGGHLIAFAGQRTVDLMGIALRLGGLEIRDSGAWLTYSGFPKSLDVSKAIDRMRDDRDDILRVTAWIREARDAAGVSNREIDAAFGFCGMAGHWTSAASQPAVPTLDQVPRLLIALGDPTVPEEIRRLIFELNGRKGEPGAAWFDREVVGGSDNGIAGGTGRHAGSEGAYGFGRAFDITAPATDDARRWEGFGTALKPALEPFILCRKPLSESSIARNVLRWGTGALNIDAARYAYGDPAWPGPQDDYGRTATRADGTLHAFRHTHGAFDPTYDGSDYAHDLGRWPANIYATPKASTAEREAGCEHLRQRTAGELTGGRKEGSDGLNSPRAGAGRTSHGRGNHHPTAKPIRLIRWLMTLVTPPGGVCLDPFLGSGTGILAAELAPGEIRCIGIEREADYVEIARARWTAREQLRAMVNEGVSPKDAKVRRTQGRLDL